MKYEQDDVIRQKVEEGKHRQVIGGLWDMMGQLQLDFLRTAGLQPGHRVIDVGCGSLRAGVPLTRYLDAGHYYGIDSQESLIEAGWQREIKPAGLADKLPRDHLHATGEFDVSVFATQFDYGIAQSVFSHMPLERLVDCLNAVAPWFRPGGTFFVTYFERPDEAAPDAPLTHAPGGIVSYPDRDPFDMTPAALTSATPEEWMLDLVGEWGHPRDQRMAGFTRR